MADKFKTMYRQTSRGRHFANGLCISCGKANDREGLQECTICAKKRYAKQRETYAQMRERGVCRLCREAVEPERLGKIYCAECAAKRSKITTEYHKQKPFSVRKCTACGKDKYNDGYNNCATCRRYARAWYSRKSAERYKMGLCIQCGKPFNNERTKVCPDCLRKKKEYKEWKKSETGFKSVTPVILQNATPK